MLMYVQHYSCCIIIALTISRKEVVNIYFMLMVNISWPLWEETGYHSGISLSIHFILQARERKYELS